ncbi:TetR/AcrR family transcriptional regulator [Streptomyces xiaopingdaonensis]|uniref:TetR/AcrR family transcriptional regulator n=1 Tax=Streptomyces xiaopingdaonensis TaxID=1565415 RepID=UPI0002EFFC36|nr:TetR/AcrR family transcriptional regulator [Streptomyces xiaopingdaonensis]
MTPPTAPRTSQEVRRRLQEAAAELIAELGWGAVSTRTVAGRARVGPGLVHYHFDSLQDLLRQATVGVMRRLTGELTALLDDAGTPEEGLERIVGALFGYAPEDPDSLLFIEAYLAATRDEELRRALGEVMGEAAAPLARWLAERCVPAAEETATVLFAALDGLMLYRSLHPGLTAEDVLPVLARTLHTPAGQPPGKQHATEERHRT